MGGRHDVSTTILHPAASRGSRRRWRYSHLLLLLNVVAVAAVLTLWWAATRFGWVGPIFLPAPGDVLHAARITLTSGELMTGSINDADPSIRGDSPTASTAVSPGPAAR